MDIVKNLAAATVDRHPCPGVAWGVVRDGELVAHGGEGVIDVGTDEPPTCDTVYRIASMTKSFTCAAVLSLRDEGAVELDRPVAEAVPALAALRGPEGSPRITLRHLMSMSAGMATDDPWADRHLDIDVDGLHAVVDAGVDFAIRTGDDFEYSNLGFGIIGRVIAEITGTRIREHVDERLLRPLGMTSTTWVQPSGRRWARPHRRVSRALVADGLDPLGDGEIAPMGGLWTTVSDLARWVAWLDAANLATPPVHGADRWLAASSRREMQRIHNYSGHRTVAGRSVATGYGFGIRTFDDPTMGLSVGHAGGLPGYGSNMQWMRGRGLGVIALSNVTYAPMERVTMRSLVELKEAGQLPDMPALPDAAAQLVVDSGRRLIDLVTNWDDAVAERLFADNVALDDPFERRAVAAADLLARHGGFEVIMLVASTRTSGSITARGTVSGLIFRIRFSLSPTGGIQWYELPAAGEA